MSDAQLNFSEDSHDEFRAEVETITPEMAAIMLQFNTQNRKINDTLVDEKVRQILGGDFLLNGETIKLSWGVEVIGPDGEPLKDADGKIIKMPILLDGQHRLHAIVKANKPVKMLVVRGVDPATQPTIDVGRKRSTGDVMRINGEKESNNLATLLSGAWKWNVGDRMFNTQPKPTPLECERLLAEDEDRFRRSLDIGLQTGHDFRDLSRSALAISHYILSGLDEEHVPYFFRLIGSGTNLDEGHPVLALRKRASSYRYTKQPMTMRRQVGLIVRTWNRCVKNERIGFLVQAVGDPVEEPLNPMGRSIPLLTSAEFKDEDNQG